MPSLLAILPGDLLLSICIEWLTIEDLVRLDRVVCHHKTRSLFLGLLASEHPGIISVAVTRFDLKSCVVSWLESRRIFMNGISFRDSNGDVPSPFLPTTGGTLQSLDLFCCYEITDAGVGRIADGCFCLQTLNLTDCNLITDAGIGHIADGCSYLQSLNLTDCSQITDAGVDRIVAGCSNLQSLDLWGCYQITDTGVRRIVAGCSNLQSLNLINCENITLKRVEAI